MALMSLQSGISSQYGMAPELSGAGTGFGAGTFLAVSSLLSGISSLGNAITQSSAIRSQARFQQAQFKFNQRLADLEAREAERVGLAEATKVRASARKLEAEQRVRFAAQGVDPRFGTPSAILDSTQFLSEMDAITVQNNAYRRAFGYKVESIGYGTQARFSRLASQGAARSTILAGGVSSIGAGLESSYYFSGGGF